LLRLELYRDAALPQLAVDGIKLKRPEANYALLGTWRVHGENRLAAMWMHVTPFLRAPNRTFESGSSLTLS
jgi:hypothetical protein